MPVIKEVDGTHITNPHRATCHCGRVGLELELPDGIVDPRHSDCSICRKKGAVVASVPLSCLKVVAGSEFLREYQFNTNFAQHFFCSACGIYTHHQRRSNPDEYSTASMLAAWRESTPSKFPTSRSTTESTIQPMPPMRYNHGFNQPPVSFTVANAVKFSGGAG